METKSEIDLYQQAETLPNAPPQYDATTAPAPVQERQPQNVYVVPAPCGLILAPTSCRVTCPACHQVQMTKVSFVNSTRTHMMALILGLTVCCCCIPYLIDSCKNTNHTCSNCGAYLGTFKN